jgi:hypothetical protein
MNTITRFLTASLLFLVSSSAMAETKVDPIAKTIGKDLESYHTFLKNVHNLIKEDKTGGWSKKCKKHHEVGVAVHQKAKKQYKSGHWLKAYKELYVAKGTLRPCFDELFTQKKLSDSVKESIRKEVLLLADQLTETKKIH